MNKLNYPSVEYFRTSPKRLMLDFQGVLLSVFVGMEHEISTHSRQRAQGLLSVQQECYDQVFICSAEVHKQDIPCRTSASAVLRGKHVRGNGVKGPNSFATILWHASGCLL